MTDSVKISSHSRTFDKKFKLTANYRLLASYFLQKFCVPDSIHARSAAEISLKSILEESLLVTKILWLSKLLHIRDRRMDLALNAGDTTEYFSWNKLSIA